MKTLKTGLLAAIAGLLALYSAGLLYEGFVSDGYSGLLTYPFVDQSAAQRAVNTLGPSASPAERTAAAQRLVDVDPANPESWMALAYADRSNHGRLTAEGLKDINRSYDLAYFDPHGAPWRVGFALDNWSALTPDMRKDVLAEAHAALGSLVHGPEMRMRLAEVTDPAGRLTAYFLLNPPPQPPSPPTPPTPAPPR